MVPLLTRRAVLVLAAFSFIAAGIGAQAADDPVAFAKSLYDLPSLWSDVLDKPEAYLAPELKTLVDENGKYDQELDYAIDYDPLVQAQEWEVLDKLTFDVETSTTTSATIKVSFVNFDEDVTVRIDLVLTDKGWRLADVHNSDGGSLVEEITQLNAAAKAVGK
jgi:hypothetical protein